MRDCVCDCVTVYVTECDSAYSGPSAMPTGPHGHLLSCTPSLLRPQGPRQGGQAAGPSPAAHSISEDRGQARWVWDLQQGPLPFPDLLCPRCRHMALTIGWGSWFHWDSKDERSGARSSHFSRGLEAVGQACPMGPSGPCGEATAVSCDD